MAAFFCLIVVTFCQEHYIILLKVDKKGHIFVKYNRRLIMRKIFIFIIFIGMVCFAFANIEHIQTSQMLQEEANRCYADMQANPDLVCD